MLAAGRGDFTAARRELEAAWEEDFPPGMHGYAWPLLYAAVVHESAVRGLPAAREGRDEVLERLRAPIRRLPHPAPVWEAYALLARAELGRAEGRSAPAEWERVVEAYEALERPYQLARARQRWAEALLAGSPADEARAARERAGQLLRRRGRRPCGWGRRRCWPRPSSSPNGPGYP